ncbi:uncharacterized protein EV422DRAFT_512669 [Fimicolochytrium jonesii]|uniref:uncharacterized protein n=1 Tax=Fimicolochytrium jonesii TaxID=1396493 RepID=UPI0022FE9A52|nr:uncharacterized protein EV422DRAFT_512669 [Fimicolochytrium jonesii]KAI8827110.1 hypothetical protein EV422DRAFT_512669 [Fimicolochytrium jonesii]
MSIPARRRQQPFLQYAESGGHVPSPLTLYPSEPGAGISPEQPPESSDIAPSSSNKRKANDDDPAGRAPTRTSSRAKRAPTASYTPDHEHNTRKKGKTSTTAPPSGPSSSRPSSAAAASSPVISAAIPRNASGAKKSSHRAGNARSGNAASNRSTRSPTEAGGSVGIETEPPRERGVDDILNFDDTVLDGDSPLVAKKKLLVRAAKVEMIAIGQDAAKLWARRRQLELDALELETSAVQDETHSCFDEGIKQAEQRNEINKARHRLEKEFYQTQCLASIKHANTDFIVRRGDARKGLLRTYYDMIWRLKDEKRKVDDAELWEEDQSIEMRVKRRKADIEELQRSSTGLPPYAKAEEYPAWIRAKILENRRQGGRVVTPPRTCEGLRKSEVEMDLDVIRAGSAAAAIANVSADVHAIANSTEKTAAASQER